MASAQNIMLQALFLLRQDLLGGLQDFAMSIGLGINADPVIIDIGTNNILESLHSEKYYKLFCRA
ncbi:MAG: hypothetical protein R2942_04310 [Ignavibacteria bacterium]